MRERSPLERLFGTHRLGVDKSKDAKHYPAHMKPKKDGK